MPKHPKIKNDTKRKVNLDPAIRSVADRVYALDNKRFDRLIVWIREAEKWRFHPVVIERALIEFEPYAMRCSNNWYAYLDKLVTKVEGRYNAEMARKTAEKHKRLLRGDDAQANKVLGKIK